MLNSSQSQNKWSEKKATKRASLVSARMKKTSQKITKRLKALTLMKLINTRLSRGIRASNLTPLMTLMGANFKGNPIQRGFQVSMMTAKKRTRSADECPNVCCRWEALNLTAVSTQVKDSIDRTNKTSNLMTTLRSKIVNSTAVNHRARLRKLVAVKQESGSQARKN